MLFRRILLLTAALVIEAALLSLCHWQYNRYYQRIAEHTARLAAPKTVITGMPVAYAFLTNQPKPGEDITGGEAGQESTVGRRLIAAVQTSQGMRIADLGWQINPADPTAAPSFTVFPKTSITVTGLTLPLPIRRGWLQGPLTTTHPQLLAFLAPEVLTSATVPPDYLAATSTSPTFPLLTIPPALKSPLMHASYAFQWALMALAFPILCFFAWKRNRVNQPSRKSRSKP